MTTPPRTPRRRLLPALLAAAVALSIPFVSAQAAPQREPSPTAGPTVAAAPTAAPTAKPTVTAAKVKAKAELKKSKQATTKTKAKKPKHTKAKPKRPTHSKAKPKKPTAQAPVAQAANPPDISSSMPRTMRDDVVGDFAGTGYDQRMRVEDDQLKTWAPAEQGGATTSVTTDLVPAVGSVMSGRWGQNIPIWGKWGWVGRRQCQGCFEVLFNAYHLNTVYVDYLDGFVYVLGTKNADKGIYDEEVDGPELKPFMYRVILYKIPVDLALHGCATEEDCAPLETFDFQTTALITSDPNGPDGARAVAPTSLSVGKIAGRTYIAAGLSDGTVSILNDRLEGTYLYDMSGIIDDNSQIVPTALDWDPEGSGLLAVTLLDWGATALFPTFDADGHLVSQHAWYQGIGPGLVPFPLSVAIAKHPTNGRNVAAIGMSDGTLRILDTTVDSAAPLVTSTGQSGGSIVAVNPIPRVNTAVAGGVDYAVAYQSAWSDVLTGVGGLFRWNGGAESPALQILNQDGTPFTTDIPSFRSWYPGTKQGRLQLTNSSDETVQVQIRSSTEAKSGCWWAPGWQDADAFPETLTIAPHTPATDYTIGMLTSGDRGSCDKPDASGSKRAYLVITPVNRPADQRVVEMQITDGLQVVFGGQDGTDQAGNNSVTITDPIKTGQLAAVGLWTATINTTGAPTPSSAPTLTMTQLTPGPSGLDNADATSAVYRFDVGSSTWVVPGLTTDASSQKQAVIPPLDVQGSLDGQNYTTIGSFQPVGAINYNPSSKTVTISKGSFFWENTTSGGTDWKYVRVQAGSGNAALPSAGQQLTTDAAVAPPNEIDKVTLALTKGPGGVFAANGIDQLPLTVTASSSTATTSSTDLSAGVYYRIGLGGKLVTNLYLAGHKGEFFAMHLAAGAYANITSGGSTVANSSIDYATTENANPTTVVAMAWSLDNDTGSDHYQGSSDQAVAPTVVGLSADQLKNYTVVLCADSGCDPTSQIAPAGTGTGPSLRAALYQAGPVPGVNNDPAAGPPQTGILFDEIALIDPTALPLEWTDDDSTPKVPISTVTVTLSTDSARVSNTDGFPSGGIIDLPIVSRGLLIVANLTK